MSSLEVSKN